MSSAAEKKPLTSDDAERGAPALARTKFRLENVCCEGETRLAKRTLADVPGVADVKVNVVGRVAYVSHHTDVITSAEICDKLNGRWARSARSWASSRSGACRSSATRPARRPAAAGVNVLMLVAVAGALALGDVADAATVCVVASAAKAAEHDCAPRRNAPPRSRRRRGDARRPDGSSVDADELVAGDVVVVRAGERVPVDGVVTKGKAAAGRVEPHGRVGARAKAKGDGVSRGTVATQGFVEVACSRARDADGAAEMARLVAEAQASTTRSQDLIGNFAAVFTPLVLAAAMSAGVLVSVRVGLVLLVLACPRARARGAHRRRVVARRGGEAGHRRQVRGGAGGAGGRRFGLRGQDGHAHAGPLPRRAARRRAGVAKPDADRMLRLAASLEARTAHPLAAAVVNEAAGGCVGDDAAASALSDDVKRVGVARRGRRGRRRGLPRPRGHGGPLRGRARRGLGAAAARRRDDALRRRRRRGRPRAERARPRAEAPGALAALRALGLGLAVLTGDKREVVDAVLAEIGTLAGGLGDVDVRAACTPADKLAYAATAAIGQNVVLSVAFKLAVVAAAFAYDVPLWVAVSADLASLLAVVANGSRPMWAGR
ncbi:cation-transporting ATPase [Aureococcus anophagefferens]|nr:cation-transporting ATPase [Aureococcus anophagefferens]